MSLFSAFKTDTTKENEGIEIPIYEAENVDGSIPTFIIARSSRQNTAYQKTVMRVTKPYQQRIANGTLDLETSEKLNLEVFCTAVLKGWKNVKTEKGKELPFSTENAKNLMVELPELYERLQNESTQIAHFKAEILEAEAKN